MSDLKDVLRMLGLFFRGKGGSREEWFGPGEENPGHFMVDETEMLFRLLRDRIKRYGGSMAAAEGSSALTKAKYRIGEQREKERALDQAFAKAYLNYVARRKENPDIGPWE